LVTRFVALKRLHLTDEESFKSEVEMLKMLKKRQHAHVVNLLATFRLKNRYYLLFPYADFNLREYWQHTPIPTYTVATVSWILHQCKAIASALQEVHVYRSTQRSDTSGSEDERCQYGRHGDIKAENILLFAEGVTDDHGHLVLADFGMTAFHKKASRSRVKPEHVTGSPSYEPPELMLHLSISRAYDIWSLGCLYLEFISWLLCGWEQLSRFPDARGGSRATTPELNDDMFFTISEGGRTAIVRQGVQDWMNDLHEMPRCSAFLHEMLNLISEHMLVVNAGNRIQIGQVNKQLALMIEKSVTDPLYLITPTPSSRRDQEPKRLSLAASRETGVFKPPLPTEGTPLPKRSSLLLGAQRMSVYLPQTEASMFIDTSPPNSPTSG
jgi:serine/threonine protein kinase